MLSQGYAKRGYANYRLGNVEAALKDIDRAIELNPWNVSAYHDRGDIFFDAGDFDKALSNYSDLIERYPRDQSAYYFRGYIYHNRQEYDLAIEEFSQAIKLRSHIPSMPRKPGTLADDSHPLDSRNRNILRLSAYFLMRGICFYRQDDVQRALEDTDRAIELDPQYTLAIYNRGFFRHSIGDLEDALADYDRAIKLDEQFASPYAGRGKYYFEQMYLHAALENFTRASELETTKHYALAGLAVTQHALGEIQIAQELWRDLLEKDERHRQSSWLVDEYGWNSPLVHEAEKLTTELDGNDATDSEAT